MKRSDIRWKALLKLKPFDERDEAAVAAGLHDDSKILMTALTVQPHLCALCFLLAGIGLFRLTGMSAMVFVGMTICIAFMYWQQHLSMHAFNQIFRAALFEAGLTLMWAVQVGLTQS